MATKTKPRDTLIPADCPPIVQPVLRCAKWCGGGCTEAQYQEAQKQALLLCTRLTETVLPLVPPEWVLL